MTPFRQTQARTVIAGALRTLAPCVASVEALRESLLQLVYDKAMWLELELLQHQARGVQARGLPAEALGVDDGD